MLQNSSQAPIQKDGDTPIFGTLDLLWESFICSLEVEFGAETLDRWVRSMKIVRSDEKSLILQARDSFHALWFEEHIRHRLPIITLPRIGTKPLNIQIVLPGQEINKKTEKKKPKSQDTKQPQVGLQSSFHLDFSDLDPTATFDSFIETNENEIVIKLLHELCSSLTSKKIATLQASGRSQPWILQTHNMPNPFYLYGGSGSGKSHLLQAVTSRLQKAGLSVIMASSELFTEHVVKSIRAGEMSTFRALWRNVDVLIVDDIHLFSRKIATQEEFFHTFNTLHTAGKQLILAANCSPQQLQYIEPRLVSRFEWGIVLPVEPLSKKQIPLVLQKKAELLHFPISSKQIDALSSLFPHNVQSAVRALETLILRISITHKNIQSLSYTHIKEMLQDRIFEEEKSALSPEKIISHVADHEGVPYEEIIGKSQSRDSLIPRQLAMYFIRKYLKLPYMKIGDIFSRDHSTVMSSIRQIEKQISADSSDIGGKVASIEMLFSE